MPDPEELFILGAAWAIYLALHSLLLWVPLRARLQKALGLRPSRYRLAYSIFSLLALAPVAWIGLHLGGAGPFFWPWPLLGLQLAAWGLALAIFLWAHASFKNGGVDLLGWDEAREMRDRPPALVTSGAYAHTRHPMNWAVFLLLWARPHGPADWVTSVVITAYVVAATFHEESRLDAQFGPGWRDYAARAPRFGWRFGRP